MCYVNTNIHAMQTLVNLNVLHINQVGTKLKLKIWINISKSGFLNTVIIWVNFHMTSQTVFNVYLKNIMKMKKPRK